MFIRIDKDLSVNIQNIFSYKLSEDMDSYKLQIWSNSGNIIHTVIYLKENLEQMKLLVDFNNTMRDLTTNVEIIKPQEVFPILGRIGEEVEEQPTHVQEQLDI